MNNAPTMILKKNTDNEKLRLASCPALEKFTGSLNWKMYVVSS